MRRTGVRLSMTTAWHPQGDGLTEMMNSILNMYIRVFCVNDQQDWPTLVLLAELYYNTTVSRTTGKTPFYLYYGQEAVLASNLSLVKASLRVTKKDSHAITRLIQPSWSRKGIWSSETLRPLWRRRKIATLVRWIRSGEISHFKWVKKYGWVQET
jgi:hypothetical protein